MKFLTLRGDDTKSNTEIQGFFKTPVIVEPKSRLALVGLEIKLNLAENETFTIESGDSVNIANAQSNACQLRPGVYGFSGLKDEVQIQIGLRGGNILPTLAVQPDNPAKGMHLLLKDDGEKLRFEQTVCDYELQDFTDQNLWDNTSGGIVSAHSFAGDGANTCVLQSDPDTPLSNASYKIQFTVDVVDELTAGIINGLGDVVHAVSVDSGGDYVITFNDTTSAGPAATVGDVVVLYREGNTLRTRIYQAGNPVAIVVDSATITEAIWLNTFGPAGDGVILLEIPAVSTAKIDDLYATRLNSTVSDSFSVAFSNLKLAEYMGWQSVGPFESSPADPAIVVAPKPTAGDGKYEPIDVLVDPFILESYIGDRNSSGPQSIVYTIHDVQNLGNSIAFSVPQLLKLDVKNTNPQNLNQIRVRFRNSITNEFLKFSGSPSVALALYAPTEA